MKDLITGSILLLLSLFAVLWLIPQGVMQVVPADNIALSARFWPYVVGGLLVVLSALLLIQGAMQWQRQLRHRKEDAAAPRVVWQWGVVAAIALLVPYYFIAENLGFLVASILAFASYALLAGERNIRSVVCWSVVVPTLITVFFVNVAQVLMPLGPLTAWFA